MLEWKLPDVWKACLRLVKDNICGGTEAVSHSSLHPDNSCDEVSSAVYFQFLR